MQGGPFGNDVLLCAPAEYRKGMTLPDHQPTPAGWQPDPATGRPRWWDGKQWTDIFMTAGNAAPSQVVGPPLPVIVKRNWSAILSLVTGILAAVTFVGSASGWTFVFATLAVGGGIDGISRVRKVASGRAMAIIGLVLGGLVWLLVGLYFLARAL